MKPLQSYLQKINPKEAVLLVNELLYQFKERPRDTRPSGNIKGDWFNLSAELGRYEEIGLALAVCIAALEQQNGDLLFDPDGKSNWKNQSVSPDGDVLAHAVQYAQAINDPRLSTLIELNGYSSNADGANPAWGWRSYVFTLTALATLGRVDEAIALGKYFMEHRAVDGDTNKVIEKLASIMNASGQREEALKLMRDWLRANPDIPGPQVITTLIDLIDGTVDPQELIQLADRGIRDLAEEQPSTSLGNLYFRRALARDRRALSNINSGLQRLGDCCEDIRLALRDYAMAEQVGVVSRIVLRQIKQRQIVLKREQIEAGCVSDTATEQGAFDKSSASDDDPASHLNAVLLELLRLIEVDGVPPERKARLIKDRLAAVDPMGRAIILSLLRQLAQDENASSELRQNINAVLPFLRDE